MDTKSRKEKRKKKEKIAEDFATEKEAKTLNKTKKKKKKRSHETNCDQDTILNVCIGSKNILIDEKHQFQKKIEATVADEECPDRPAKKHKKKKKKREHLNDNEEIEPPKKRKRTQHKLIDLSCDDSHNDPFNTEAAALKGQEERVEAEVNSAQSVKCNHDALELAPSKKRKKKKKEHERTDDTKNKTSLVAKKPLESKDHTDLITPSKKKKRKKSSKNLKEEPESPEHFNNSSSSSDNAVRETKRRHGSKKTGKNKEKDLDKSCVEIEKSESSLSSSGTCGQWQGALFENQERQNKFLRLLGGMKQNSSEKHQNQNGAAKTKTLFNSNNEKKKGLFGSLTSKMSARSNTALSALDAANLNQKLEDEYNRAMDFKLNSKKGTGLGFTPDPAESKTFHIDISKSNSIKFDD